MKILFCPRATVPFHGNSLLEKPLGGLEASVIHLAKALDDLGHEVIVLSEIECPPQTKPLYLPHTQGEKIGPLDVFIGIRDWHTVCIPNSAKRRFFWTRDAYTNPLSIGIGDKRVVDKIEASFFSSEWHRQTICMTSHFPLEKAKLLRDGVFLKLFEGSEKRARRRLIYAAHPQRGLSYLAIIFLKLKEKYPDLELHIFNNVASNDPSWPPLVSSDKANSAILNIFRALPGCFVHGTVLQHVLARELMKSAIFTYPCNVEETSCTIAKEAQAAGCALLTSNLGAMRETVGNSGLLISGVPGSEDFIEKYLTALDQLLADDELFHKLSQNSLKRASIFDWKVQAQEFLKHIEN